MAKAPKQTSRERSRLQHMNRGKGVCWANANTEEMLCVQTVP